MRKFILLMALFSLCACANRAPRYKKVTELTTYRQIGVLDPMGEVIVRPYYVVPPIPDYYTINDCTLKNNRFYYYRTAYR